MMSLESPSHEAWRSCYRELAPKLLLFARQWVASAADAEDVVQTAFVRFWRKQPDAQREHYPLLYAAVRTVALDLIRADERRGRREMQFHEEAVAKQEPLFEMPEARREEAAELQGALDSLPAPQRQTLVLRIWGGLTFAEIATALGESINTVSSRYRYAIEALRRRPIPSHYERVRA
jgi:RNA polymerase sigma-70 factor, ECF subfamily